MSVAVHEASHGVVAVAVGMTPTCLSVRPREGTSGRMHHGPAVFEALAQDNDPDLFTRLAVISLAGALGEAWVSRGYFDFKPFAYSWDDPSARMDLDRVALLAELELDGGDIRRLVRAWSVRTIGWVSPHIRNGTIEKVAAALEERKVLLGTEIERIVKVRSARATRIDPDEDVRHSRGPSRLAASDGQGA